MALSCFLSLYIDDRHNPSHPTDPLPRPLAPFTLPWAPHHSIPLQPCTFCHFLSLSPQAQLLHAPLLQISALVTRMRIGGSNHQDFASMGPCKGDAPHELAWGWNCTGKPRVTEHLQESSPLAIAVSFADQPVMTLWHMGGHQCSPWTHRSMWK